jgi:dihydrofolate synthase/folylpolyglutamate synthase
MHVLGNKLTEIAAQKAGIIKSGNQVFMHPQPEEIIQVFKEAADNQQAILNVLSIDRGAPGTSAFGQLPGYQQRNWLLAKGAFDFVQTRDQLPVLSAAQLAQTMHVQVPGRMDIKHIGGKTIVMDGAHNGQKMDAFVNSFKVLFPNQKATVVLSLKEGKEYQAVLPLLQPICSSLVITTFRAAQDVPAVAIEPDILATAAKEFGFQHTTVEPDNQKAYELALSQTDEVLVVTGSFYLLAALRPTILSI